MQPRVNPWTTTNRKPSLFYGLNDNLGLVVAMLMGLQHAFAMMGGIVTPPLLIGQSSGNDELKRYLVNAALICSGLCTFLQVFGLPLFGKYRIGSGVLSVMGTSFTSLNLALGSITKLTVSVPYALPIRLPGRRHHASCSPLAPRLRNMRVALLRFPYGRTGRTHVTAAWPHCSVAGCTLRPSPV
jgi:hypothetical protein